MKVRPYVCFSLLVWLFPTASWAETDSMLWTSAQVKADLPRDFEVAAIQNVRFDQGMSELESILPEAELEYEPLSWLGLSTVYRYIAERSKSGDLEYGHRFLMSAGAERDWGSLEASYRLGYQIKNELDEEELATRIRNRFGLKYDTDTAFTPGVSTELYTNPDGESFVHDKYRLTVTCAVELIDDHRFKIGYRMQPELGDDDDKDVEQILLLDYAYTFSVGKN